MLELHPKDCHNFDKFSHLDRCPLVSVCDENCVYVWKATYDNNTNNANYHEASSELEEIDELRSELAIMENNKDVEEERADKFEFKYNQVIEDLTKILKGDSIEKLDEYYNDGTVSEWAEEVLLRRKIYYDNKSK